MKEEDSLLDELDTLLTADKIDPKAVSEVLKQLPSNKIIETLTAHRKELGGSYIDLAREQGVLSGLLSGLTIEQIFQVGLKSVNITALAANEKLKGREIKPAKSNNLDQARQDLISHLTSDQGNATAVMAAMLTHRNHEAALEYERKKAEIKIRIANERPERLAKNEAEYKGLIQRHNNNISAAKSELKNKKELKTDKDEIDDEEVELHALYNLKDTKSKDKESISQKAITDKKQAIKSLKDGFKGDQAALGAKIRANWKSENILTDMAKRLKVLLTEGKIHLDEKDKSARTRNIEEQKMLGRVIRSDQMTGFIDTIGAKLKNLPKGRWR